MFQLDHHDLVSFLGIQVLCECLAQILDGVDLLTQMDMLRSIQRHGQGLKVGNSGLSRS